MNSSGVEAQFIQGESNGGELNSPKAQDHHHNNQLPFLEVEKHEEDLSHNGSLKVRIFEKAANEEEGKIGIIDKRSKIGCVNESETLQYSNKQPLIAMQTTSWKGCCGILDLLSSSDR
uniref:Uncharacterized protein n=1 Tax=Lactuca sativa TaxID=4236 RepID=A0A9R1XV12_LACSA|nr:hypothetical protein LSAT_V11C100044420 [Lactuca sativa]